MNYSDNNLPAHNSHGHFWNFPIDMSLIHHLAGNF